MSDEFDLTPGYFHRLMLRLGKPLGLNWLSFSQIAFVLHNENFNRLERGPKWFWLVPGVQRILFTLTVWPDKFQCIIESIRSSDGLRLNFTLAFGYRFDPTRMPNTGDQARLAANYREQQSRRQEIVLEAQRALQVIAAEFTGEELIRNTLIEAIEGRLLDALDKRLGAFGMSLMREHCKLLSINAPDSLNERMEIAAQREVSMNRIAQADMRDFAAALRAEAIETLKDMTDGHPYLNMSDLADGAGSGTDKKEGNTARILPEPTKGSTPTQPTQPRPQPSQQPPRKKRPRSRL